MHFIDAIIVGYSAGVRRAELLRECRDSGREFLHGREHNADGKYVYDLLDEARVVQDSVRGNRVKVLGYLGHILRHPAQAYLDARDRDDIIMSEVRPV